MDSDCLRKNERFSASGEPIFKIPDAMCRKIDALSIFGALIDQTLAPHGPPAASSGDLAARTKY